MFTDTQFRQLMDDIVSSREMRGALFRSLAADFLVSADDEEGFEYLSRMLPVHHPGDFEEESYPADALTDSHAVKGAMLVLLGNYMLASGGWMFSEPSYFNNTQPLERLRYNERGTTQFSCTNCGSYHRVTMPDRVTVSECSYC